MISKEILNFPLKQYGAEAELDIARLPYLSNSNCFGRDRQDSLQKIA